MKAYCRCREFSGCGNYCKKTKHTDCRINRKTAKRFGFSTTQDLCKSIAKMKICLCNNCCLQTA